MKNNIYILETNWSYCGGGMVVVAKDKNSIVEQILQSEKNAHFPAIKEKRENAEKYKHLKDCGGYKSSLEREIKDMEETKKIKVFDSVKESKGEENDWIISHIIPTDLPEEILLYNYNYA